jgi:hypothetical protein
MEYIESGSKMVVYASAKPQVQIPVPPKGKDGTLYL